MVLFSICIPTYNRCEQLKETLETIVKDDTFLNTNEVEVVISDNCSTDSTRNICEEFVQKFPDKIHYYKTEENIGADNNFYRVFTLGKGKLLKINNDKCSFMEGTIGRIVNHIKDNMDEKYVLHFLNDDLKSRNKFIICDDINKFVKVASYHSTWVGGFAMWKTDFEKMEDFGRYAHLKLVQNDVLCRLLVQKRPIKVFNEKFFRVLSARDNGGYNPAEVFGKNYLFILNEHVKTKALKKSVYEKEKKIVLFELVGRTYFDFKNEFIFKDTGYFEHLFPYYKYNLYFYYWIVANFLKQKLYGLHDSYNYIWLNSNVFIYKYILRNPSKADYCKEKIDYYKSFKEPKSV